MEGVMDFKNPVGRRTFLMTSGMAAVGGGMIPGLQAGEVQDSGEKEVKIKEYRTLGRTGFKASDIGYGAGNLTNSNVLEVALDMGVNYIDTAEHYMRGQSEKAVGSVLKNRDRKSIFLTTKLNLVFGGSTHEALKERFRKCLERLQTDYIDCLMIHMTPTVEQIAHEDFHAVVRELKTEGKVRFIGLSNHGTEHVLAGRVEDSMESVIMAAAEDGRFDVVLFVYNFIQKKQGEKIIDACRAKNMGVTLMKINPVNFYEGVKQGFAQAEEQGRTIPEMYTKMLDEYKALADKAEAFKKEYGLRGGEQVRDAAVKFVLGHPGVHSVCATIDTLDGLETFVSLSGKRLESTETSMLERYDSLLGRYYCRHACGSCESSCSRGVPVNTIMRYNHYFEVQHREKHAMQKYTRLDVDAGCCSTCAGECERACPYGVPVRSLLFRAHHHLSFA